MVNEVVTGHANVLQVAKMLNVDLVEDEGWIGLLPPQAHTMQTSKT